ncbi:MAG TPA: hypothetical protein VLB68_27185 [Pyrinomonadaceae bacterium]|nr:hypothetical protein [Pyrinomonadaceae bacterium]
MRNLFLLKSIPRTRAICLLLWFGLVIWVAAPIGLTQAPERATGVLRLRVRVKVDDASPLRGLARKRFFLIRGSREQNLDVVHAIEQNTLPSRDCYYSKLGASEQLRAWLRSGDCESIYCRAVDQNFVTGPNAVPEFTEAYAMGQKEFGNDETALRWISTKVSANLRDGFYKSRQSFVQTILKQAQGSAETQVRSVMTDSNGTAYFTELEPGPYVLSSIVPTELGANSAIWNCDVLIKTGDLATEKPYLVSNRNDKNVKCVAVERPLPSCEK